MPPTPPLLPPPRWLSDDLERHRQRAIQIFRKQRLEEPLEVYLRSFDEQQQAFEDLLELTVDLTQIRERAVDILADKRLRDALRYIAAPPISDDDWKTLAEATFSRRKLQQDPALADRLIQTILSVRDRRRFPWLSELRDPNDAGRETVSAALASAAMAAMRRSETARRSESKKAQELFVEDALTERQFLKVAPRRVRTLAEAPGPGEFCREAMLGTRKADFIVGLPDRRVMPLECKVSNSYTNSIKRLNNDAAVKAEVWRHDFGDMNVVPAAVLSGVYKLHNLEDAQRRGLTLWWSHSLEDQLLDWIDRTGT